MMNLKNNEKSRLSSQFYITLGDCSTFDGQTVLFGHIIQGKKRYGNMFIASN